MPRELLALLGLAALYFAWSGRAREVVTSALDTIQTAMWSLPIPGEPYAVAIDAAEASYGIPRMLLGRLLWQESRFRPDIIFGQTVSPAGALGIAQFMPETATELGLDPLDPYAAIDGAGRYLAGLYRRFGNWPEAVAAYNWGQGNVSRLGIERAPSETRNYVASILADVPVA